jgi:hypothetical protein
MSIELDRRKSHHDAEAGDTALASQPTELDTAETMELPPVRKTDFWIIPIPKRRRHVPGRDAAAEFPFTWKTNAAFAAAAVSAMPTHV